MYRSQVCRIDDVRSRAQTGTLDDAGEYLGAETSPRNFVQCIRLSKKSLIQLYTASGRFVLSVELLVTIQEKLTRCQYRNW